MITPVSGSAGSLLQPLDSSKKPSNMCSISWQTHPQGYDLFFNRDEQRDRPAAESPKLFRDSAGLAYLAPIDPQGGGTWIFLNAFGLTGAVLNAYEVDSPPDLKNPASRGQLLRSLTHTANVGAFQAELSIRLGQNAYPPCYLFALDHQHTTGLWIWTGERLEPLPMPTLNFFTTSSFQSDEVRARREQAFKKTLGEPPHTPDALEAFHLDAKSHLSAFDIRMSRPDARSVSYTRVRLRKDVGTMRYAPRNRDDLFEPPLETGL